MLFAEPVLGSCGTWHGMAWQLSPLFSNMEARIEVGVQAEW